MEILWIIVGIAGVIVIWAIFAYNNFISLVNRVKEAWSDIDVQLKRRYDLIPNLVETVKGYMQHEARTLENVTEMRTRAMSAETPHDKAEAENMLSGALKTLFAVSENYPDLKANTNFIELQREITDTENKIQAARRFYNSVVQDMNTAVQSFPNSVIAGMFKFTEKEFFVLDEEAAKEPVKVQF